MAQLLAMERGLGIMSDLTAGEVARAERKKKSGADKRKDRRTKSLCAATEGILSPRASVIVTIVFVKHNGGKSYHREFLDSMKEAMARAQAASCNAHVDIVNVHSNGIRICDFVAGVRMRL